MRPQVKGTVGRGQLEEQDPFYLGYDPSKLTAIDTLETGKFVSLQEPKAADGAAGTTTPAADGAAQTPAAPAALNLPWIDKLPIEVNETNMALGKQKFETYCSACHGYAGFGDGLVHKRADSLAQGYWLAPTSLHVDKVRTQPVGQIFNTISKGQGKMASYASSLNPKERWAVVLYVRALQKSRNADMSEVPADMVKTLDEVK